MCQCPLYRFSVDRRSTFAGLCVSCCAVNGLRLRQHPPAEVTKRNNPHGEPEFNKDYFLNDAVAKQLIGFMSLRWYPLVSSSLRVTNKFITNVVEFHFAFLRHRILQLIHCLKNACSFSTSAEGSAKQPHHNIFQRAQQSSHI
ncbi:uncharacterized protein MONOS_4619 [Monocercomonoides exilis]|uniref:uncharacterized protein n=1 Tax=Monocercomonoides exilis TaxID=2049356 RepID=UPI00355AA9DE|nr:hypothetical protein MONOS_4619 [Monocercomonoides exilis]|eukprot:MONOS_4619.1-p1 / transcript=MONOS_4619.1 / gene=MONOS_4619 / organism=Monocercomonoides_exilis_PA203 / gene_product=unspecified product / transcript_product=unspecified product / location=Mono_scaffold00124:110366-111127(-) / protein_length=143 / sequence_SO=supercontig / SO=protein_coding / is_pseudo=false